MVADAFDMWPSRIMLPKNVDVENVCRGRSFPYPFCLSLSHCYHAAVDFHSPN